MAGPTRSSNRAPGPAGSQGELALLAAVGFVLMVAAVLLLGGGLAALIFGGGWTWPPPPQLGRTVAGIVTHTGHPASGYPAGLAARVPGATPFWAVTGTLFAVMVFAGTIAVVGLAGHRGDAGYATRRELTDQLGPKALRRGADELRPGGVAPPTSRIDPAAAKTVQDVEEPC